MITNLQDYILHSHLFKTYSVDELLFVEYRCLIDDPASGIWAHHNYLAYVLGGEKKWKTPKNEYRVGSGEALFIQKGANTVYQYFDEPFYVLFIFLPDDFIRQTLSKYPELSTPATGLKSPDDAIIHLELNKVLEAFFQSLFSFFQQKMPPPKSLLKLKMEELILNVLSQPHNESLRQYFLGLGQHQKVDLKEVMRQNYVQPLSIADYARLCARSLSTFRRDFKAVFHTTPGKWLLRQRLNYAKFLLDTTDKTVSEIVEESGFRNRSHFMKLFRESYGMPALQYRNHFSGNRPPQQLI